MKDEVFVIIKKDGKTTYRKLQDNVSDLGGNHLCSSCANMAICEKVKDIHKKRIDKYSFIDSGYQIVKNGIVDNFTVTKCQDCKKYINSERNGFKRHDMLESMYTLRFEADDVNEALQIQQEQYDKGLLEDYYRSNVR